MVHALIVSDQLPWQSSAPHLSDQNSIAAEASAHQQPRQFSQTPDYSQATRQDEQEARPEPITTDAERMFPNTSSSNYTITDGSLNGKRPHPYHLLRVDEMDCRLING